MNTSQESSSRILAALFRWQTQAQTQVVASSLLTLPTTSSLILISSHFSQSTRCLDELLQAWTSSMQSPLFLQQGRAQETALSNRLSSPHLLLVLTNHV